MKKFVMTAVAAAALSAGMAHAYTMGTFSNGFVVPNVIHNGAADTTAVGMVNQTGGTVGMFWTFFDQNSGHVTDGCVALTDKQYKPFVWSEESGVGLAGKRGYLVFAMGATTNGASAAAVCAPANEVAQGAPATGLGVAAAAFQVDSAKSDVAVIPVIDGPLTIDLTASSGSLRRMGPASLTAVAGAAPVGSTLAMRYAIDGAKNSGVDSRIVVWSIGDQRGSHTVIAYDDKQNSKSVNFDLTEAELSSFDPETILGMPASFRDGFLEWNTRQTPGALAGATPVSGDELFTKTANGVFSYSVVYAPAFGAVQSILGAHRP